MIVGFSILDFNGQEAAAIDFISRVCILDSPDIAQNIVAEGVGINIFAKDLTLDELNQQPFTYSLIETKDDEHLIVSAVNFIIELSYNGRVLRLKPTEYISVSALEVPQFKEYYDMGLIRAIPDVDWSDRPWLLAEGLWDDDGVWIDDESWED